MWKIKIFMTRSAMLNWIEKHKGKIQYNEIFVNNAYGVEYRMLRRVY